MNPLLVIVIIGIVVVAEVMLFVVKLNFGLTSGLVRRYRP